MPVAAVSYPLPLPPPRRLAPVPAAPRPQSAPVRLWLCAHLPKLALEALVAPSDRPLAVAQGEGIRRLVSACNTAAEQHGVRPGLRVSAALALVPALRVHSRHEQRERVALTRLAAWAQRYTPVVVPEDGVALLLEVRASLKLFGGLAALRADLTRGLEAQGYTHRVGIAPTPLAARWLARAGVNDPVLSMETLASRLAALPVHALGWPATTVERLERFGARRLGEVLRLPRDGLARRLGREWPARLDRALGRLPDPRQAFVAPEQFRATLDLPLETRGRDRLMSAFQHLLGQMEAFLVSRDAGVASLQAVLHHREPTPTRVFLRLRRPGRQAGELAGLLAHRLESVMLAAPVLRVSLRTGGLRPWQAVSGELVRGAAELDAGLEGLIQRLQARLGTDAVYGVAPLADHRPERAWRKTAPLAAATGTVPARLRPLWLLPAPRPLGRSEAPARCRLLTGPERIVSGWWDGHAVARDYYLARHADGRRLWVFQDLGRHNQGWFLHGMFA